MAYEPDIWPPNCKSNMLLWVLCVLVSKNYRPCRFFHWIHTKKIQDRPIYYFVFGKACRVLNVLHQKPTWSKKDTWQLACQWSITNHSTIMFTKVDCCMRLTKPVYCWSVSVIEIPHDESVTSVMVFVWKVVLCACGKSHHGWCWCSNMMMCFNTVDTIITNMKIKNVMHYLS